MSMQVDNPDGTQVHLSRLIAAPVDRVWQAFTDPELFAQWRWGGYTRNAEATIDLRVGGRYQVYVDADATKDGWHRDRIGILGVYVTIEPESRLSYTLHWDAPVGYNQQGGVVLDEVVDVRFEERDGGTWVELLHSGIPDDGVSAPEHARGNAQEFDWLARLVEA